MKLIVYIYNTKSVALEALLNNKYISELEKSSFEKYKNLETKKEKIVSAIFKNKYVGHYHTNEFGKPLSNEKYFNVSHSKGYVAFVSDQVPVGIDIEKVRNAEEDLIKFISSEKEKEYIHDNETFFEIWTNKEALVKAIGSGIKDKISSIPGLPINGIRVYKDKTFMNKTIRVDDTIITVSRQDNETFDLEVCKEVI